MKQQLDELDLDVLRVAYSFIKRSLSKRVTGSEIWNEFGNFCFTASPKLQKLARRGLLKKDEENSTDGKAVYQPTEAGYEKIQQIHLLAAV